MTGLAFSRMMTMIWIFSQYLSAGSTYTPVYMVIDYCGPVIA